MKRFLTTVYGIVTTIAFFVGPGSRNHVCRGSDSG